MRHDVIAEAYEIDDLDIDPSLLAISEQVDVDLDDVFNALGYHMDCCRVRLMSTVEFKELC
jgi:DNA-directed RNA polymerase subunit N (RpoN/RPB10)